MVTTDICIIDTDVYKHPILQRLVLEVNEKKEIGFIRKQLKILVVILHPLLFQLMDSCTQRHIIVSSV